MFWLFFFFGLFWTGVRVFQEVCQCFNLYSLTFKDICTTCNMWRCIYMPNIIFLSYALQCFNLYSLIYKYICSTCNMWRCMPKRVTSLVTVIAPVSQRRTQPSFSYQSSSMSSSYQVSLSLRIYEFVSDYMLFCNVIMWTDSICVNIIFLSEFIFVLFFSSEIAGLC